MERKVQIIEVKSNYRGQFEDNMDTLYKYLKEGFDIQSSTVFGNKIIYILIKNKQ